MMSRSVFVTNVLIECNVRGIVGGDDLAQNSPLIDCSPFPKIHLHHYVLQSAFSYIVEYFTDPKEMRAFS